MLGLRWSFCRCAPHGGLGCFNIAEGLARRNESQYSRRSATLRTTCRLKTADKNAEHSGAGFEAKNELVGDDRY
jgi:hypothetical protein